MPQSPERHAEYLRGRYKNDPAYREAHKQRIAKNKEQYKAEIRQLIAGFKGNGCLICKEPEPCCLSAHHIDPSVKSFNISTHAMAHTPKRVREELAKCVCLCENCHRKVHAGILDIPGEWS